jgi:hypothetical protein
MAGSVPPNVDGWGLPVIGPTIRREGRSGDVTKVAPARVTGTG